MLSFGVTLYVTMDCVDGNLHVSVTNSCLCRSARLGMDRRALEYVGSDSNIQSLSLPSANPSGHVTQSPFATAKNYPLVLHPALHRPAHH